MFSVVNNNIYHLVKVVNRKYSMNVHHNIRKKNKDVQKLSKENKRTCVKCRQFNRHKN